MFEQKIDTERLVKTAPEVLDDCSFALNWLELLGKSNSLAALKLRSAIRRLENAGVRELYRDVTDVEESGFLPNDFSLTTTDIVD